jgi:subtilase family serine protease
MGFAVLGWALGLGQISFAQSPRPDRIAGSIAGSPAVWLEGNRRPMFQPENDLGPVADSQKLENITLMFKLTQSQQADLTTLLAEQQDRSSPNYHHWLTPEQYADRFGLTRNDISKVVAWLQSQGFQVTQTARSRTWVSFSGTTAQVRSTFHTEIHNYSLEGKTFFSNASEPAVPAVLADLVLGITSLDNYGPKARSVFRHVDAGPKPDFTSYISSNNFVTPGDFATIYDLNALYSSGIDGTGQSIAVMGQTDILLTDVATFRSLSSLPANPPNVILVPGVTDPGVVTDDIQEASLDVEWSGAVARNATINFVNGGTNGVYSAALPYAVDHNVAPVISLSYGLCESQWTSTQLQTVEGLFQQASSQGQTIVAAAGDAGAADCDSAPTPTSILTIASLGLAVDFPASSPFVTGMGGAEFNEGAGNFWLPAPNGTDVISSAQSYIPEKAWNDTSATDGILAGGGGASIKFTKPSWQTGTGVPSDGARDVPDLSLNASPVHDGPLTCVQGSCANGFRQVSANPTENNLLTVAGGTSAAAPPFAGIVALINQQMNTPGGQGNINPTLYAMAATSPAAFHDITTGNNIVPCTVVASDTGCPSSGQMGFSAGVGYDQATGLGSIDAYNLVTEWPGGSGNLPAPTLTTPANGATAVALSTGFSWTPVSGASGYQILVATSPALLITNPTLSACGGCVIFASTSGANTTTYTPASALTAGTLYYWEVQATGASGKAAWSNAFVFNTGTPDFSLSASPSTVSIAPGGTGTTTLTLTPIDSFLPNTLTFSCSVASTLVGVTCAVGELGGNNTITVTLTAATTATSYPAFPRGPRLDGWPLAAFALLCLLLISLSIYRRGGMRTPWWNVRTMALGGVLAVLLLAGVSCGGGSGGGSGGGGGGSTPTGESGTVTVTGTSTTATHSTSFTVSVS